jgi:hypothetical protein
MHRARTDTEPHRDGRAEKETIACRMSTCNIDDYEETNVPSPGPKKPSRMRKDILEDGINVYSWL